MESWRRSLLLPGETLSGCHRQGFRKATRTYLEAWRFPCQSREYVKPRIQSVSWELRDPQDQVNGRANPCASLRSDQP